MDDMVKTMEVCEAVGLAVSEDKTETIRSERTRQQRSCTFRQRSRRIPENAQKKNVVYLGSRAAEYAECNFGFKSRCLAPLQQLLRGAM